MRRLSITLVSLLLAVGVVVSDASDATAAPTTIVGAGEVRAGMYSSAGFLDVTKDFDALNAWTGKGATFGGTFHNVYESEPGRCSWNPPTYDCWSKNTETLLEQVWQAEATPVANFDINDSAAAIASGQYDSAILQWATRVRTWTQKTGGPQRTLFIAPLQEHNGDWVPYGCDPVNFRTAYAKIRSLVNSVVDPDLVRWVWAPNGWTSDKGTCAGHTLGDYYPGSSIVDVIGFSSYRWPGDDADKLEQNVSASALFMRQVDPTKPFLVLQTAEWNTGNTSDRNQWIRNLFTWAAADENVVGVVWFNFLKETDWRMWNPSTQTPILTGWKDGMQQDSTIHEWPLTDWFQGGELPFTPVPARQLSERVSNTNRYSTSKQVSAETFAPGVPVAYVATGLSFPDALAAAAAGGAQGGPVLLIPGTSVPSYIFAELDRLDPQRIVVVGGAAAVSDSVLSQLESYAPRVYRIGGVNRFQTAYYVAIDAFEGPVPIAYVATGRDFPDALAAAAAAGAQGGPVLLTETGFLPQPTRNALIALEPAEIVVVGGTAAVSDAVETELQGLDWEPVVTRVAGTNRYQTAALLADFASNPETVFVATGLEFPDALAGAAAAGYLGAPLLLTQPYSVPGPTYNQLAGYDPNPNRIVVLGGTGAVSEYVSWQLFLAANG